MDGVQGPKWGCGWPEAPRRGPPSVVAGTVFMLLAARLMAESIGPRRGGVWRRWSGRS
jgi:hypothetical protein